MTRRLGDVIKMGLVFLLALLAGCASKQAIRISDLYVEETYDYPDHDLAEVVGQYRRRHTKLYVVRPDGDREHIGTGFYQFSYAVSDDGESIVWLNWGRDGTVPGIYRHTPSSGAECLFENAGVVDLPEKLPRLPAGIMAIKGADLRTWALEARGHLQKV